MTHETMTIHKALAELKVIDNRINKAIGDSTFVCANKHSNEKISGMSVTDFKDTIKANYNKITDLINRRNAIKRAVVLSNSSTNVVVGGKTYTVAEAIDMKNHGMELYNNLINNITYQNDNSMNDINRNTGDHLEKSAEQYVLSVIQAQPKESKMSVDSESMQALRKDYIKNNAYDLIDPIDVKSVISTMRDTIDSFNTDVDSALSVSNALTVIEIDY